MTLSLRPHPGGLGLAGEVGAGTGLGPGRCGRPQVLLATVATHLLALRGSQSAGRWAQRPPVCGASWGFHETEGAG